MISYKEYKNRVYKLFLNNCLKDLSIKERIDYLKDNEILIRKSYKGDLYSYKYLAIKNVFSINCMLSRIVSNLEYLY